MATIPVDEAADVVSWDVRAVYELKYDEAIDSFRKAAKRSA
jgi:hypothetical protein